MAAVRAGWTASALVRETRIEPAELARFLRLTAPVFARNMDRERFTRAQHSKLTRLVTVLDRAERILGDRARAVYWVKSANRAFGFSTPLDLLDTKSGVDRVCGVLSRIESGQFA